MTESQSSDSHQRLRDKVLINFPTFRKYRSFAVKWFVISVITFTVVDLTVKYGKPWVDDYIRKIAYEEATDASSMILLDLPAYVEHVLKEREKDE